MGGGSPEAEVSVSTHGSGKARKDLLVCPGTHSCLPGEVGFPLMFSSSPMSLAPFLLGFGAEMGVSRGKAPFGSGPYAKFSTPVILPH